MEQKRLFNSTKDTDYCAPITSFDWNEVDPAIVGAVSIDTTCTIWDITVIRDRHSFTLLTTL